MYGTAFSVCSLFPVASIDGSELTYLEGHGTALSEDGLYFVADFVCSVVVGHEEVWVSDSDSDSELETREVTQELRVLIGWSLADGPAAAAPYVIAHYWRNANRPLPLATHAHELMYGENENVYFIVDMRKGDDEGNFVQKLVVRGIRHMAREMALSASHAAVCDGAGVTVWDRASGQVVRQIDAACWPLVVLKGSLLIGWTGSGVNRATVYDLSAGGDDGAGSKSPATQVETAPSLEAHLYGDKLLVVSEGGVSLSLCEYDLGTGELVGERALPGCLGSKLGNDWSCFVSGDLFCVFSVAGFWSRDQHPNRRFSEGRDSERGEARRDILCIDLRTGSLSHTHASYTEGIGAVVQVPSHEHDRLVFWRQDVVDWGPAVCKWV